MRIVFVSALIFGMAVYADLASMLSEGKQFGLAENNKQISRNDTFDPSQITPENAKPFEGTQAREVVCQESTPDSPILDFVQDTVVQKNEQVINPNDHYITRSEKIIQKASTDEIEDEIHTDYSIEICKLSDIPYATSYVRNLEVQVILHPEEKKDVKVCRQHTYKKKFDKRRDAENAIANLKRDLTSDPTIKSFEISDPEGRGTFHRYVVTAVWRHHDDTPSCTHAYQELKTITPAHYEETGQRWIYEDPAIAALLGSPDCTLVEKTCLDREEKKIINGKEVHRQCWKEKFSLLCSMKQNNECPLLQNKHCELLNKNCLQSGSNGCFIWELTFRCYTNMVKRTIDTHGLLGSQNELTEVNYEPNGSFSDVSSKLAVFEAMQKDLQSSEECDMAKISIFKGVKRICSKNVADGMMYDCCFSHSGLAKKLGVAKCTAEEIALAEMREKGLCHYVGSYSKEFANLWKSRDEHVFCCFSSKLSRVVQEQAHEQLKKSWGPPEKANCSGLSIDEMSRLDFSKLNLREVYNDASSPQLAEKMQSKMEGFQKRVQMKLDGEIAKQDV